MVAIRRSLRILLQEKNTPKKIYSLHEPEVCCIGKGKDRVRYEFGQQAAVVKTNSRNWVINVEDLPDNPYFVGFYRRGCDRFAFLRRRGRCHAELWEATKRKEGFFRDD
jgi:hypothetical protein